MNTRDIFDTDPDGEGVDSKPSESGQPERLKTNLVDQYLALLLVIMATAGFFDVSVYPNSLYTS